jgi:hypothetical protein
VTDQPLARRGGIIRLTTAHPVGRRFWCRLSISRLAARLNTTVHHGVDVTTTSGVTMTGSTTEGIKNALHPVSGLATAKPVYTALLGAPPQVAVLRL